MAGVMMGPVLRYAAGKLGIMDYERVGEGERKEQKGKRGQKEKLEERWNRGVYEDATRHKPLNQI